MISVYLEPCCIIASGYIRTTRLLLEAALLRVPHANKEMRTNSAAYFELRSVVP